MVSFTKIQSYFQICRKKAHQTKYLLGSKLITAFITVNVQFCFVKIDNFYKTIELVVKTEGYLFFMECLF